MDAGRGQFNVCLDFLQTLSRFKNLEICFRTFLKVKKKITFTALQNRIPCLLRKILKPPCSFHKTLYLAVLCIFNVSNLWGYYSGKYIFTLYCGFYTVLYHFYKLFLYRSLISCILIQIYRCLAVNILQFFHVKKNL